MRLLNSTDDPTKIGGPGPVINVNPNSKAVRVEPVTQQVSDAPSSFAVVTEASNVVLGDGDVLSVQNLGTNPLFVKRGSGASSSSLNYVLAGGTVNDDGKGGVLVIDDFVGTVSITGTSPRYLAWK